MPFYMTFFVDHSSGVTFADIERGLRAADQAYRVAVLEHRPTDAFESADLYDSDHSLARLEINRPGDRLFRAEIQDYKEVLQRGGKGQKSRVITTLSRATAILRVQVLWGLWPAICR